MKQNKALLSGWGRYPTQECFTFRPEYKNDLVEILSSSLQENYIPYGLGRSYGDTSLNCNRGVVLMNKINCFLSFDELTGILECEAGVTLEEIIEVFLPKGYFLPTTPGTKYVTLGGAVANDVHGKNHHIDGCISEHIIEFTLLLASGRIIKCSREENPDIFWATVGGIGLTGIILTVKIRLIKIETAYYNVKYEKAESIDQALELFAQSDDQYKYSVAWIDCLSKGKSLGRSILMRGNHASVKDLNTNTEPLSIKRKKKINVPIDFPSFTLNYFTIKAFNTMYYKIHKNTTKLVDYDSFFYPLDSILNWNKMYGKKGFVQYQAVIPTSESREGLIKILELLSQSNRGSFLAVLKSSGEEGFGLLSFPKKGYTLALDIPIKDNSLFPFLRKLDEIVLKYNGRVYLAKDSELSPEMFAVMYPRLKQFREIKKKIDPNNLFASSIARRLKILED